MKFSSSLIRILFLLCRIYDDHLAERSDGRAAAINLDRQFN